ncbi:hypothetical protein L1049_011952 [Liquidambar formosana]|uniref:Protein kinase domain-containing protein n=1 Tax=Liquidambar formosana TaxID=63359 RepID=A0AAP0WYG1_LIQFO
MENKAKVLMERYDIGRLLGQGNFAKVYFARNLKTGQSVAIKVIDKEKVLKVGLIDQTKREISVMKLVKHPNVIQLYEVMASKTKIYFVMEYAKGGELFNKVAKGRLKEDTARKYFQQLISAVDFCHSRGVYHRDLKPENLLLDENGSLKVSDFGLSALAESKRQDGLLHTTCGTPAYVAPEIISRKGYNGAKADIWSCGVILFVLLGGYLPFHDSNLMEMYRKIAKADYRCPHWFPVEPASTIISKLEDIARHLKLKPNATMVKAGNGMGFWTLICYALGVWFGGKLIIDEGYMGGDVINVLFAVLTGSLSLGQASPCLGTFAAGQAAAFKMFKAIKRKPQIDAYDTNGQKLDDIYGDIELKDNFGPLPSYIQNYPKFKKRQVPGNAERCA